MIRHLATWLTILLTAPVASSVSAQGTGDWSPPAPSETEQDWLRLNSGEWLAGDLESLTDDDVKFDSAELEDLTIDWSDISELRSPRRHTYRFEGREIVTGTASMKDGRIRIDTGSGVVERDRARLVSMISGEPKELNFWSGEASLGLGLKRGNTNNTDLNLYAMLERATALTRWRTQYNGYVSTRDGDETDNNHRLNSTFDLFLTRRLYIAVPTFEYYTDEFVNIDARITAGSSLGYEVFKNRYLLWDVNGGVAYQYQTTTVPDDEGESDAAVLLGTSIETDPLDNLEWDTSYSVAIVVTDMDKTNQNLRSVLSLDIWGPLDLDTTFSWDRVQKPALNEDGTRPVSDDFRLSVGLGIDFLIAPAPLAAAPGVTTDEIVSRCVDVAAAFSAQREARRRRTALDPADFAALHDAGFPLLSVPEAHGGAWRDAASAVRPLCRVVGALAEADPSLALVVTMHPAVLGYWLTSPEVPPAWADAWRAQRSRIFEEVRAGAFWGTITSEPGSGGDVLKTRTRAAATPDAPGWAITGDKHFGSGAGASTHMVTTALPDGESLPDLFFLSLRDVPWDGSRGVTLLAEWDGHGMAATQSHAFRFESFPAERIAAPMAALPGTALGIALYECSFAAVIAGVVRVAVETAAAKLAPRRDTLRAFERVEWSRVRNEAWLVEQALAGMIGALERDDRPDENALRGKTAIAELAESALARLGRVLGGATFSRSAPFGTWAQDVRALGFLRPPWGLAFDQLHAQDFREPAE